MPVHDWTRVPAGDYHGFHLSWVAKLVEALNTGGLPADFYADAEPADQHVVEVFDPLPPPSSVPSKRPKFPTGTLRRTAAVSNSDTQRQRRLVVRYARGHRLVGVVEVNTPGNTRNRSSALHLLTRCRMLIDAGVHLTVVNLFPPNRVSPRGLTVELWRKYDRVPLTAPDGRPLCVASVRSTDRPEGFFKFLAVGDELPAFPLFLSDTLSVGLPLADPYAAAFAGSPPYLRELLAAPAPTGA